MSSLFKGTVARDFSICPFYESMPTLSQGLKESFGIKKVLRYAHWKAMNFSVSKVRKLYSYISQI